MKFGDILGETLLNEELSNGYHKVSHKVKLLYKILRTGSIKIGNLIPNAEFPLWTGFETIKDRDTLITYKLSNEYHLLPGNAIISYEIIIKGITINCEKYPALSDDYDIKMDVLRYIIRRFQKYLASSLEQGEGIEIKVGRGHQIDNTFLNVINESLVDDEKEKERIINKSKLVYKTFRKGKVKVRVPSIFNNGETVMVTANYELPTKFKIRLDFENSWNRPVQIFVPIEGVKIEFDFKSKNDAVQNELLQSFHHKIKMKFVDYDSNCDIHFINPSNSIKNTEDHVVK
jgi:hypothetical protein